MHIGVDILGLPHMIMVTTANVTDRNGAIDMVDLGQPMWVPKKQIQKKP